MKIRETTSISATGSRFDAGSAEETIAELDTLYAAGEIELHAYLEKKRSLVRLFLKATTQPRRKTRREDWE